MPSRDDWCRASQRMAGVRKLQPDPPYADARHGPHDDRGRSLGQHREPANDASGPQSIPARRRGRGHYRADEKRDDVRTRRGIKAQPAIKGGVMQASNLTPAGDADAVTHVAGKRLRHPPLIPEPIRQSLGSGLPTGPRGGFPSMRMSLLDALPWPIRCG